MRRYALSGGGEPKKAHNNVRGEGVFFKERTYAHELFKIGVLTMFLNFLFCFLISLFLISSSGRLVALPDHRLDFLNPII